MKRRAQAMAAARLQGLSAPIYDGNREVRNAIVANWGIGGSSTDSGANRLANSLSTTKSQLLGNNYIVLIMYGTNDMNFGIFFGNLGKQY